MLLNFLVDDSQFNYIKKIGTNKQTNKHQHNYEIVGFGGLNLLNLVVLILEWSRVESPPIAESVLIIIQHFSIFFSFLSQANWAIFVSWNTQTGKLSMFF